MSERADQADREIATKAVAGLVPNWNREAAIDVVAAALKEMRKQTVLATRAEAKRLKRVNAAMYEALKIIDLLAQRTAFNEEGWVEIDPDTIAKVRAALASAEHQENET